MNVYHNAKVRLPGAFSIRVMPVVVSAVAVVFLLAFASTAAAGNRYWVGGSGNWSDNTNHWSASSGGSPGADLPTASDNVFFDANSHTIDYMVILDVVADCADMTWGNPSSGSPTLASGAGWGMKIYGSMTLVEGMTFTVVQVLFLATTTGKTITTAGVELSMPGTGGVGFQGIGGGWTLQDSLTIVDGGQIFFENGAFDANNFDVTVPSVYCYADIGYSPVVNMGAGTWTITGNDLPWGSASWWVDEYSSEVASITPETSTITFTDATDTIKTFGNYIEGVAGGGHAYNNIRFAGAGEFAIEGVQTINDLHVDAGSSTISGDSDIYLMGSLDVGSGTTWSLAGRIHFDGTTIGNTITTNGVKLGDCLFYEGAGGEWILQDDLTCTYFDMGNGTIDANGHSVTSDTDITFFAEGGYTPTAILGSGTWTCKDFFISEYYGEVVTLDAGTSTIKVVHAPGDAYRHRFFNGGGTGIDHTFYNVWFTGAVGGDFRIGDDSSDDTADSTFTDFKVDCGQTVKFKEGTTTTVATFRVLGTGDCGITLDSIDGISQFALSKAGGIVSCDYLAISNSTAAGGAGWYAGAHSTDGGNNGGWIFSEAPTVTPAPTDTPTATPTEAPTPPPTAPAGLVPGNLLWAKKAGGGGDDRGYGIVFYPDGTSVITGAFSQTATFGEGEACETTLTSAGDVDIFVARDNADGTLAWAKRAGGSGTDWGNGIASYADGTSVVTGVFWGTATFGAGELIETTLTAAGVTDIFLAKYNADGTLAWAKRAGGSSGRWDIGCGIASYADGTSVVTGYFAETATFGPGEANETTLMAAADSDDIFIAKYNADGTLVWAKRAGGSCYDDWGEKIASYSDGTSVITGGFCGTATFGSGELNETTLTAAEETDIFIAKYNADGTLAWAKWAGGSGYNCGGSIASYADGTSVITGVFQTATFGAGEAGETTLVSEGDWDIFIAQYNADGALAWAKRAGGSAWDEGCGIASYSNGTSVVTGLFAGIATFGSGELNETALTSEGSIDIFLAKYNADGALAWAMRAGGSAWDQGLSVASHADGPCVMTGSFSATATFGEGEANETTLTEAGGGDIFIAKYFDEPPPTPTPTPVPQSYSEWIAQYPGVGGDAAEGDDPDGDGWTNGAEYNYWKATGEASDPADVASGGQAIGLEPGWNLIGLSADVCYFEPGSQPFEGEVLIPVGSGNYEEVPSIGALLDGMGIAGQVEKIAGWHPSGGGAKEPVTWEGNPALDNLTYIAGGYGYWVKAGEACTWKIAGRLRLKAAGGAKEVALAPGWNAAAPLFAKVHYEEATPSAGFGSDEAGRWEEIDICGYLLGLVTVGDEGAPEAVGAMIMYDEVHPFVRTYYAEVPPFLQTLKYAGPGLGMLVRVDPEATGAAIVYPAE